MNYIGNCRIDECTCTTHKLYARVHGCVEHGQTPPIIDVATMLKWSLIGQVDCDCSGVKRSFLQLALDRLTRERPSTWRDNVAEATRKLHPAFVAEIEAEMWRRK